MELYGLWHTQEKRFLTLFDLQRPCPMAIALYDSEENAQYDINHRVAPKDKEFIKIKAVI